MKGYNVSVEREAMCAGLGVCGFKMEKGGTLGMKELICRLVPLQAGSDGHQWAGSWIYLAEASTSIFSQNDVLIHSFSVTWSF